MDKLQNVLDAWYGCLGRAADKVPDMMLVDNGLKPQHLIKMSGQLGAPSILPLKKIPDTHCI
jgi:hypothetical protein